MQTAIEYAKRGWYVFPISPGTKVPYKGFDWKNKSTNNPDVIRAAAEGRYKGCNWAVDCEKSGIFILDADEGKTKEGRVKEGLKSVDSLPVDRETFTVKTRAGGLHFYYEGCIAKNSESSLALDVDTRGFGGYALIPGSKVIENGVIGVYELVKDIPLLKTPQWFPDNLKSAEIRKTDTPSSIDAPEHVRLALEYLINEAPEAIEGQGGDNTTYRVAARLRDLGMSEQKAYSLMSEIWNPMKASPPWDEDDLAKKVSHAYKYAQNSLGCDTPEAMFPAHDLMKNVRRMSELQLQTIKPYDWIIPGRYLPGFFTVTVARGGAGKSRLGLLEAVSIATGENLCHGDIRKKGPVYLFTSEDPFDEIDRRTAAILKHHGVKLEEIKDLYCTSGYESPICFAKLDQNKKPIINENLVKGLIERLKQLKCILCILDPLVEIHELPENDSTMKTMVEILRRIASESGCAVSLIHHTSKGIKEAGDMDSARGSSAIVYGARFAHTLLEMSEKEAKQFGIPDGGHRWYVRIDNAKSNYTAPATKCDWYKKISVPIFKDSDQTVGTLEKADLSVVTEKTDEELIVDRVFEMLEYGESKSVNSIAKRIKEEKFVKGSKTVIYDMIEEAFYATVHRDAEEVSLILSQGPDGEAVKMLEKKFTMFDL